MKAPEQLSATEYASGMGLIAALAIEMLCGLSMLDYFLYLFSPMLFAGFNAVIASATVWSVVRCLNRRDDPRHAPQNSVAGRDVTFCRHGAPSCRGRDPAALPFIVPSADSALPNPSRY
jgi:hypothetical protein